ncbi:GSCFA domain-containing protein [Methylomagnum ishizawai]|uniref:GSCFA domain-containing protein n=1 Tax=Methylomagnum ishizawai TaxID=1760988 RepID=UPI001C3254F8|nr:GSCFA domain-containing protein [Methylomagnum ishizawai]BBL75045.1 hypothetical protein MishRS11D_21430 [Methylomagnum ishizawai]
MPNNPYQELDDKSFWRKAIADRSVFDIGDLWQPKFVIQREDPVSTYGSCFAQHIGRALSDRGFNWLISETAPRHCSESLARRYNYGVFSARTGNIYTTSLLDQWVRWALDESKIPHESWLKDGRYIDPFRPAMEPTGFATMGELRKSRIQAVRCFRKSIADAYCFVFTLGLTESWFNAEAGYEYPMCPGTVAGEFSAQKHRFVNQNYEQVLSSLISAISNIRKINKDIKFILTVSPVPLTATASGKHVLVATIHSKSTLRAVAGEMANIDGSVDYFPSYEIINGPQAGGIFFEPNKRNVHPAGVEFVMNTFFKCMHGDIHSAKPRPRRIVKEQQPSPPRREKPQKRQSSDEVCEELLLDAFGGKK